MSINSTLSRMFAAIIFTALACVSMSCFGKKTEDKSSEPEITPTEPTSETIEPKASTDPTSTTTDDKPVESATTETELAIATEDQKTLTLDLGDGVSLELVLIPAGEFIMGYDNGNSNEKPAHNVKITKPFYIGKYEVTQKQYEKVMGTNPSFFVGFKGAMNPMKPVESIPWDDAQVFCNKLSQITGYTVSLPTEAQWEYACRAGSTTKWHFGDDKSQLGEYEWYRTRSDGYNRPVGQKKPNAWGLYDMHGNVMEWCLDWYSTTYENTPYPPSYYKICYDLGTVSDPLGPSTGSYRVLRGGAWDEPADFCRSTSRWGRAPINRGSNQGFRIVAVRR